MSDNRIIDGQMLMQMFLAAVDKLNAEKAAIDSLNVFPVPDGDTGTNMSLTMNSAGRFIGKLAAEDKITVPEVAKQMAHGALMGARGNSGVILSQILGGFASALIKQQVVDGDSLVQGFASGVESAYKAVVKPMEGTILTVAREASGYLNQQYVQGMSVEECLHLYLAEGYRSLARTPDILPVLKQAGVVDAGAKGLLVIVEGMLAGLGGEYSFVPPTPAETASYDMDEHFFVDPESIIFQYCTELIIKNKTDVDIEAARNFLGEIGDSILVVGTGDVTKIHVHTNHPGQVLEYGGALGDLNDIKIENMKAQSQRNFVTDEPLKELAVVAVSSGEGLNDILKSMGVDYIISGGQTMNPSTEEFLDAIANVKAKNVILLPNNKNIILTAEQAAKIEEKSHVFVVPTRTIPQGISSLMVYNIEVGAEENARRMQEAAGHVISGEITHAVRDTSIGEREIKEGQFLGIVDGSIAVVSDDMQTIVKDTLEVMETGSYELVTLYYGIDVTQKDANALLAEVEALYPEVDFELHFGAQAVYFYLISVE